MLIKHLRLFEENRKDINDSPSDRGKYAKAIAENCAIPCAQWILAGHFRVTYKNDQKEEIARLIVPTAIELYYHEEDEGRFKDPIMYHSNDGMLAKRGPYMKKRRMTEIPFFPIGSLNPHPSGIDITFENKAERYRASFLIREYKFIEGEVEELIENSTDLYDDLLLEGICHDNHHIEWCDGKELDPKEIVRSWRKNVADYDFVESNNPLSWKKKEGVRGEEGTFTSGKYTFVRCPFNWQFRLGPLPDNHKNN